MIDLINQKVLLGDIVILTKPGTPGMLCLGKVIEVYDLIIKIEYLANGNSFTYCAPQDIFKPDICSITKYLLSKE